MLDAPKEAHAALRDVHPLRGGARVRHTIAVTVNGSRIEREVESRTLLVHFLREELGLTGTHIGCDTSSCGACTLHDRR